MNCSLPKLILILGMGLSACQLAPPESEITPTSEPTKIARYVPPPTVTQTQTSLPTRMFAPTQTPMPTRTRTLTRTPTLQPKPTASATASIEPIDVGEKYGTLALVGAPSAVAGELNLAARGFVPTNSILGLVDYTGPFDEGAPQLFRIFSNEKIPPLASAYQVFDWDAICNCRGALQSDPPVTLVGVSIPSGEILRLPRSSYYLEQDYQAILIYADAERVTLNYSRSANPIRGYTLYLEGIAVDSSLLNLYQKMDGAGRAGLPAIQPGQGLGRARGGENRIAIRDAGGFMDPRSRKDWWRGK